MSQERFLSKILMISTYKLPKVSYVCFESKVWFKLNCKKLCHMEHIVILDPFMIKFKYTITGVNFTKTHRINVKFYTSCHWTEINQFFTNQWWSKECVYIDGLKQDCSNSSALPLKLLQSCAKQSILPLPNLCILNHHKWRHMRTT